MNSYMSRKHVFEHGDWQSNPVFSNYGQHVSSSVMEAEADFYARKGQFFENRWGSSPNERKNPFEDTNEL